MRTAWTKTIAALSCLTLLGALTAIAQAEITQRGVLQLSVDGKLSPRSLPRKGAAPISVAVDWNLATTDASPVPKLKKLGIEINRHGHFDTTGLPVCDVRRIQTASTARALAACHASLVGKGSFTANVALRDQVPYATAGKLVVFNGMQRKRPVLLGQIYSPYPFPTSFVIVFSVKDKPHGTYGTALTAKLPRSLSSWGNLTGINMKLSRRFHGAGKSRSYVSAGCPAPKGFPLATFPMARASFSFEGGSRLSSVLSSTCRARG